MMHARIATLIAGWLSLTAVQAPEANTPLPLSLYRLDCGSFTINDYNAFFSDTMAYKPGPKELTSSCYLIQHGDRYLLWDAGLPERLLGKPEVTPAQTMRLSTSLVQQLAQLGLKPEQVSFLGVSHYHLDHVGQARSFPKAALVMGAGDVDEIKRSPERFVEEREALEPWLEGKSRLVSVNGDVDIFRDGRVQMLKMPGHTPGHSALLVKLDSGNVLLAGDLYHFAEQVPSRGVPPFNTSRAETLASMDRFEQLAKNLNAKVVIQHDPDHVSRLPAFPKPAR